MNLRPQDTLHKSYMNRLLIEIIDDPQLSQCLAFKGGTCATMLGYLDRFSVDLDFDLLNKEKGQILRENFHKIFKKLGLTVVNEHAKLLFFQAKYPGNQQRQRSTIKISAHDIPVTANEYKVQYFKEIDRLMKAQTIETMFANKLVALTDRHKKYNTIAGRDVYDIHHYFTHGYRYKAQVIRERTNLQAQDYMRVLLEFVNKHVTQTIINEDLNTLLQPDIFQQIRKVLLPETLHFLTQEVEKQSHAV